MAKRIANNVKLLQPDKLPADWRELLLAIPGYDSIATAGNCLFDPEAAQTALDFFPNVLTHTEGLLAGEPFRLERWQQAVVANLFGWVEDKTGTRRYREVLIYVPRKNGKTPWCAGICLYVLACEGEVGAQIYGAAGDRDQAALLFNQAKGMVENEEALSDRLRIYGGQGQRKQILYEDLHSYYRIISADSGGSHGKNSSMVVVDELHEQPDSKLMDSLETSFASANRKHPLLIMLTTADYDRESVCNEKYDYACQVRDGVIDDVAFMPVIYEASIDDDWTSETVWEKANPNLGVSVDADYLRRECAKAKQVPRREAVFKRWHLDIRTDASSPWLPMDFWRLCGNAGWVDQAELVGRGCCAGLDLSSTMDLTALVLVFPCDPADGDDEKPRYAVLPFFWLPENRAPGRDVRNQHLYDEWARRGALELTPGNSVSQIRVAKRIVELADTYKIHEIAYDRWGSNWMEEELQADGLKIAPLGQGYRSMSAPSKDLEELIVGRRLEHFGHPVLKWNASNAVADTDSAGNIKPNKKKSANKIDGIVALIMGLAKAAVYRERISAYEERGVIWV